ncbi:hypothetical protein Aperf_G00000097004 [Anoplocephala perfoliata]
MFWYSLPLASYHHLTSKRPECIAAFTRFRYCGIYCGGREGPRAEICPAACDNFIKACFVDVASSDPSSSLSTVWSQLINAITTTIKRLERTQNFASVNKDLHIFLSEAITYVHQKYATVKPSLMQECKYTSGSSSGNTAGGYKPAGNNWSFSSRLRRALDNSTLDADPTLSRIKRQGSYPGAAWQQQDPQSAWGAPPTSLGNQMSPSQLHGSYQSYFQPGRRGGNGGGLGGGGENSRFSANVPEKLNKWASQLKFYYSGVQDLFNRAPPSVCAATSQPNSACWNPQPLSPSSQSKRYTVAISDLHTLSGRLDMMNSQNNGDPEAFEVGAQVLAEAKMRNASSAAVNSPRGGPSLLQSMSPSPAGQMYGQPSVRSHDPWRTGAAVANFGPPQPVMPSAAAGDSPSAYSPGSPYQIPPTSPGAGGGPGPLPNNMDMDTAESGYDPAGGAPAPGTQSGIPQPQPGYVPSPPRQPGYPISPQQPPNFSPTSAESAQPPPNQLWGGPPGDTEGSGFGEPNPGAGSSGTWGQGSPWQQPVPPSSNLWEPHPQPQPQPQPVKPQPSQTGNSYRLPPNNFSPDQQQGSGDGVLSGPEPYRPPELPPVVEIVPTTTTTLALPTTTITTLPTTTTSASTMTTSSSTTTSTTTTTTTTSAPITERGKHVNASLPRPPSQPIGGFDDEDFEQPTQTLPHQPPGVTQQPWNPQHPGQQFGPEASGYFPDSQGTNNQGGGGVPHLGPPLSPPSQIPDGPPDCSPEAMASAGSGVDPRCLPGGAPPDGSMPYQPGKPGVAHPQTPDWSSPSGSLDLEGEGSRAGSGMAPDDVLEPPPPPPHQLPSQPYPGYSPSGESSHMRPPDFPGLSEFEGLVPPQQGTQLPTTDLNRPYHAPTKKPPLPQQPSSTVPAPARELPPDIWLPVPELKPGDPRLPDSKLFLPDFPPPMLGGRTSSAISLSSKSPFLAVFLPLLMLLANTNIRG